MKDDFTILESMEDHERTPVDIGFIKLLRQEGGFEQDGKIRGSLVTPIKYTDERTFRTTSKDVSLRLEEDGDLFHYQPGPYFQDPRLIQGTRFARSWYPGCKLSNPVRTVGSRPDYHAIRAWLERCSTHHEECQAPVSKKIDIIRVIDVVKRVLVSYRNCNFARYAALSYVWGKAFQPRMGDLKDLPQVLPRTIEHALLAVQQMGLRYLWVDSICIKQDSPEDKAEQISIMGDIYAGAFMTLIALDGADADSGLAGVNQAVPRTPQPFLNIGSLRLMARCPRFDYALRNSPWMQRGWTYQEGILSRRCIFISTSQVYYLCNTMYCSEDLHDAHNFGFLREQAMEEGVPVQLQNVFQQLLSPLRATDEEIGRHEALTLFKRLLDQYLYRTTSFDADAILAFSALLQHLESTSMPHGFLWGLPRLDFRNSLLWVGGHERRPLLNNDLPSWSWAGWKFFREGLSTRARGLITIRAGRAGNVPPPLKIWHDGNELEMDEANRLAVANINDLNDTPLQDIWADVHPANDNSISHQESHLATPPTKSALFVEGLILTVSSTYFASSGLALCFSDDFTCRCRTHSSGTRGSLERLGFDRKFLIVNTWSESEQSVLRLLLLGGEGSILAREGYVELDVKAQLDLSGSLVIDGLRHKACMQIKRFWLV